jgi:hypothetical protein
VRQIVVQALKERDEDRIVDQRLLNEVRLAPALRLAAKAIIEGNLDGIAHLISVIDRLDKLPGLSRRPVYDESARAKLLAKLSIDRGHTGRAASAESAPKPPVNP